ncbi:unnamed protein product [Brassica oleracea var. botrytis]|uniref:Uncharacterized protein n=2 Tax=Brassica TaxID=3705 RepID=A0A3P6AGM6_BRAOL|nr:unnamed protein product [Brassica napus]CDY07982.1 BnaC03g35410D [Brassica napus]VDC92906.1 unnamed protein product [Brassica oleracea]
MLGNILMLQGQKVSCTTLSMSHHISEYDMAEEGDLFKALEKVVWRRRRFQPSRLFAGPGNLGCLAQC